METFCLYEFGGRCPTFEEAAALTCDDCRFVEDGSGTPPIVSDGEVSGCPPHVGCVTDSATLDYLTSIYFTSQGAGTAISVDLRWDEDPECPVRAWYGDPGC